MACNRETGSLPLKVIVTVKGKVQGVSFRKQTKIVAEQERVAGWVQNLPDGSVQACFEGRRRAVETLFRWCMKGPEHADVTGFSLDYSTYYGEHEGFIIR